MNGPSVSCQTPKNNRLRGETTTYLEPKQAEKHRFGFQVRCLTLAIPAFPVF